MMIKTIFLFPFLSLFLLSEGTKTGSPNSSGFLKELAGSLVKLEGKNLKKFDDTSLSKTKYFVFYYSAHWCPPCQVFTPQFVSFYNQQKPKHPEFEAIFVSLDRSEDAMKQYMEETKMPWPALKFDQIESKPKIKAYAGDGIPCVVVVDRNGKVVSDTFQGNNYLDPQKPLDDLLKLLK